VCVCVCVCVLSAVHSFSFVQAFLFIALIGFRTTAEVAPHDNSPELEFFAYFFFRLLEKDGEI
jgi:hypothetical protein